MTWTMGTMVAWSDRTDEIDNAGLPQVGFGGPESEKAIDEVAFALKTLVESGVFGPGPFHVTANGHSNPEGQQGESGPTFVTLSITSEEMLPEDFRTPSAEVHAAAAIQAAEAGLSDDIVEGE